MFQEEIGEVFDRWKSPVIQSPGIPPLPPPRSHKKPIITQSPLVNGRRPYQKPYHQLLRTNSLPSPKKRNGDLDRTLNAWSESLLAEFNTIIANELTSLLAADAEDEDDVFCPEGEELNMIRYRTTRSKSLGNQTPPLSPATSPSTSDTSSGSAGSGRPMRPITRSQRSQMPQDKGPVLLRVTPLPDQDVLDTHSTCCDDLDTSGTHSERGAHTPDEGINCCDSEGSTTQVLKRRPT